jgi:diguanylate cyclase (GGDEF)-like protein
VYLVDKENWVLRLRASQGRHLASFGVEIPVADTIIGYAFREGTVQEDAVDPTTGSAGWIVDEQISSQAAVPLRSGENVFGVMVMGSASLRELSPAEMERFTVLGNQSSLALQNALLHEELERLSVTDRLTELYNHGYLQQRLDEELNRADRFNHPLGLIMLDIDDFKAFNDAYGHPRGDAVLKGVSQVIKANLREMDIAARYGGEEFVVLLPETELEGVVAVAERIRAQFAEMAMAAFEDAPVGRTVSVGVASYPEHARTPSKLVDAADKAMYRAKRSGKNRVISAE